MMAGWPRPSFFEKKNTKLNLVQQGKVKGMKKVLFEISIYTKTSKASASKASKFERVEKFSDWKVPKTQVS